MAERARRTRGNIDESERRLGRGSWMEEQGATDEERSRARGRAKNYRMNE